MFSPTREKGAIKWGVRDTPYARPQEFGSDAHWAPIKPLKEWAGRVVGDESFGYYVQWKIAQEGTEANPYMRPGRAAQVRWYRSHDVSDEIDKELR